MNGWHPGEASIRHKLGFDTDPSMLFGYTWIQGDLPHDHAQFHSTRLPFLPVTTLDVHGRPWGSILAGTGERGFVSYPRHTTLVAHAKIWEGDPIKEIKFEEDGTALIAGIGVELSTRRRNKLAGKITKIDKSDTWNIEVTVNEAIGNCPKYIAVRELDPYPAAPQVADRNLNMEDSDRLPSEALSLIQQSDTIFFGTTHDSRAPLFPSHVGMNIRGGRPGFVRVLPSDGRTLVLPDYSGNRIFTSLGNIEATPLASLTFPSFTTGDILYVTGRARNVVDKEEAGKMMFHQDRLTTLYVTGYVYIRNALPFRQRLGTEAQLSPYSPPVRYLTEEIQTSRKLLDQDAVDATLTRIKLHSPTIATLSFSTSACLDITPGQAIILDLKSFIGVPKYAHMAPSNPVSLNDDRIRTWTISRSSPNAFSITVKLKPGGAATGAIFAIAHKAPHELLADMRPLELKLPVLGLTGDFSLPSTSGKKKALMIAGGIGVTPFLDMLRHAGEWDVVLLLATREPAVLVPLIFESLIGVGIKPRVEVFTSETAFDAEVYQGVVVHRGRLTGEYLVDRKDEWEGRLVFVCGPAGIRTVAVDGLTSAGVPLENIKVEGFEY